MGSRLLDAAVLLGTALSAVLLGVMLAAPLISQPAAVVPPATVPAASEAPNQGLPPLGLYLLRGPYAFGPCLAVELVPESYPVAENALEGAATVLWWQRGVSGCDSRTGEVEVVAAIVTHVARLDAPEETLGYTIGFHLPPRAEVPTSIELTILADRSTQDLLQVVDSGGGGGQGLVFDLVEAIDPILDPLPSATPVAALQPVGLYLLSGPLLSADGPCIVLVLDRAAYTSDPTIPGTATVRWWERGGDDPEDPAACLTRRSEVSEVPASVVTVFGPTGAVAAYAVSFAVPLAPGAAPDAVGLDVQLDLSSEDVLRASVATPTAATIGFDRVDSIDPPLVTP